MRRTLASALLAAAAAAAGAEDFPRLKPGLWEVTTTASRSEGGAPRRTSMCLDDSVQQDMYRMSTGMMSGMCSRHEIKVAGSRVTSDAVCDLGGARMQAQSVMTLTGNTAYRTEARATFDPPMMGVRESVTVIEGRHAGPCAAGQEPGDMTLPGGGKMNIRQLLGQQKG